MWPRGWAGLTQKLPCFSLTEGKEQRRAWSEEAAGLIEAEHATGMGAGMGMEGGAMGLAGASVVGEL